jgi:cellulose synthase (UDP-forming)
VPASRQMRAGPPGLLEPIVTGRAAVLQQVGGLLWLAAFAWFWSWWFEPSHFTAWLPFTMVTLTMAWITLAPAYFLAIFGNSRRPSPLTAVPVGVRIAMVVTKAPSEPFAVVAETLTAMLAQDIAHDTWLADENPSPDTLAWAAAHGVRVSTRHGVADYHRSDWPRRTRCKEGNLAYFYDHYGYENYDIVVQLDADHVPAPGYLRAMLQPFADPAVGYVSAPSICDRNAAQSWSARGRLYAEASMHGSLQAGYNGGWAPLCIGSHYAVRTTALRQIGGLGPELAEDHSTTLMMNAHGWRGVHAIDAIATGFGPNTFADLVTQEYQWSRSLATILFRYTPRYLGRLSPRLRFQFLFAQLWYPLFSLFMLISFAMPVVALLGDFSFANVSYVEFVLHSAPMGLVLTILAFRWRRGGTFRPYDAKILSWETFAFVFARWPWALLGTLVAVLDCLRSTPVQFRVTPKDAGEVAPVPLRLLAPYAALSAVSAVAVLAIAPRAVASGFFLFAAANAMIYAALVILIVVSHHRENRVRGRGAWHLPAVVATAILLATPSAVTARHGLETLEALSWRSPWFSLTETTFSVAGAGMGAAGSRRLSFHFQWLDPQTQP